MVGRLVVWLVGCEVGGMGGVVGGWEWVVVRVGSWVDGWLMGSV